jgi:hypothetical protein
MKTNDFTKRERPPLLWRGVRGEARLESEWTWRDEDTILKRFPCSCFYELPTVICYFRCTL